jgi:glycosyltransferase involved in cell wall biosynthesis
MSHMRVLLNTKPSLISNKTGVGYYVFNLYRELLKSGADVTPTLNAKSGALVGSLSRASALLRKHVGKWYPSFVSKLGDSLIGHLSSRGEGSASFDIYHETSLDPMPETDIMSVRNIYDLAFISCPGFLDEDFAKNAGMNIIKSVPAVERIIVNSQFVKDEAMNFLKLPEEKIDIIPLAPAPVYYRLGGALSAPGCVKKFTQKEYVLYVGTVEPRKNLKVLIKAFGAMRAKRDISLIIAGGFSYLYDDIISYPEELGLGDDVIFTGYVDEGTLLHLYNRALVFVYPSLYEGFGLPPLEAMSCGAPVIVSDIPPLREITGDAAMVFSPKDHEDLADKMSALLSSAQLRVEQREKGLARVREYSWEKVAGLTVRTYAKALER